MDAHNGSPSHIQVVPGDGGRAEADARRPIGEIFVELGYISRAELESALDVQRATGGRIGEILVDQGSLTRIDLASALAEHWEPHPYVDDGTHPEGPLNGVLQPAALQGDPEPEPEPDQKPRRGRLRRSATREDALAEQLDRLEARLRADHDRALAEHVQSLALRLDRVESRVVQIDLVEARLGAVSELTDELRGELSALAQQKPAVDPSERLLELSLRIDRAARDSHDRIAALAAELRTEVAVKSAGLDARLQAQLDEAAALQRRFAEVQEDATAALAGTRETMAELHVETGSLEGRLDELFGLRHADAQVARVANERLAARVEDLIAHREADEDDAAEAVRASDRALLEALSDLARELTASASKQGKPGKGLRRSIDSLTAAIAAADARLPD